MFIENSEALNLSKDQINKAINLPNGDVTISDVEVMKCKPKMPISKRKASRHSHSHVSTKGSGHQGLYVPAEIDMPIPLSPAIRRSAINNLVGTNAYSSTSSTEESKYSRNEQLPDMKASIKQNTPEGKKFNVRVGSLQTSGESSPIGSPQGVVGAALSKSNPLSHRE
jgi:hypothetical protein